jgi:hypothetical protein
MTSPLFQTNFLPLLIQVNFFPFAVAVLPAFLQASPAFTAATALRGAKKTEMMISPPSHRFITE